MKISKKQKQEIDFMSNFSYKFIPTEQEIEEYINETVHGIKTEVEGFNKTSNRLSEAKRSLDISVKMWRRDITNGLLGISELVEDYKDYPFGMKVIKSVARTIDFSEWEKGQGFVAIAMWNGIYIKDTLLCK